MNKENKSTSKKCLHCGQYDGYYIKGAGNFKSLKMGHCRLRDKLVKCGDGCKHWSTNYHRYQYRKRVATRALYDILMNLSAVRQILQESRDEEKIIDEDKK